MGEGLVCVFLCAHCYISVPAKSPRTGTYFHEWRLIMIFIGLHLSLGYKLGSIGIWGCILSTWQHLLLWFFNQKKTKNKSFQISMVNNRWNLVPMNTLCGKKILSFPLISHAEITSNLWAACTALAYTCTLEMHNKTNLTWAKPDIQTSVWSLNIWQQLFSCSGPFCSGPWSALFILPGTLFWTQRACGLGK